MKNLKKIKDFQSLQLDASKLQKVNGGRMASIGSEIDYGTHVGGGEYTNDTTEDA